jgi:hypothetical protein
VAERVQVRPISNDEGNRAVVAFLRCVRSLHPADERLAIIPANFSPHLSTKTDRRVGDHAAAHNIDLIYVLFNASSLIRIEAQVTGLRYFGLHGTDHPSHKEQARAIRR